MSYRIPKKIGTVTAALLLLLTLAFLPALLLSPVAENAELENTYYPVTAQSSNEAFGTVEVLPSKYQNDDGLYLYGTEVVLTATPKTGYRFVQWIGSGKESKSNPMNVILDGGADAVYSFTAYFEPISYEIILDYEGTVQFKEGDGLPKYHTYGTPTKLPSPLDNSGYVFKGWYASSVNIENKFYAPESSLGADDYAGTIYLRPVFDPLPYTVRCIDKTMKNQELGVVEIHSHYNATVSPLDAAETSYRGYWFDPATVTGDPLIVTGNSEQNVVYRYYQAKTFRIIYQNCDKESELFTYGEDKTVTKPQRTGYTFLGWTVSNHGAEGALYYNFAASHDYDGNSLVIPADAYDHANWTYDTRDSEEIAIVLTARWSADSYSVSYEDNDGVKNRPHFNNFPDSRVFDTEFTPAAPVRAGYTFLGWTVKGSDAEPSLSLTLKTEATALTLVAHWQVNTYQITLNGGAENVVMGEETVNVTFDQPFPQILVPPTREGYTFTGFYYHGDHQSVTPYYYFDSESSAWVGALWDLPENATLYAHWSINSYTVEFDDALLESAEIAVNGEIYQSGHPFVFDYDTVITVVVRVKEGNKLVTWNGQPVTHTANGTFSYTVKGATVLTGSVAPELSAPDFRVNYQTECFSVGENGIPAGSYCLIFGETRLRFTVGGDGVITFEDASTDIRLSAEPYFGKTVALIACGDGTATSDSDPSELIIPTRPTAPKMNLDIDHVTPTSNTVEIKMKENGTYTYEFACSTKFSADGAELEWFGNGLFENLMAGTPYYVYIRVAASETYPHGEAYIVEKVTLPEQFRMEMINKVRALMQPEDGEMVKRLVNKAVEDMEALQPSETYVSDMEQILERVKNGIGFARLQDTAIAKLQELHNSLYSTGLYSETLGVPMLNNLKESAVNEVIAAENASDIQRIWDNAQIQLGAVPISYLKIEDTLLVTVNAGMDKDYRIAMSRIDDLITISSMIERAVTAQNIVIAGKQMTLAEAPALLREMDVVGYYRLQLTHSNASSVAKPQAPYEIRLLLPEDLRDETGLIVGYYQTGSDQLTVLDTRREGNYLIFTADSVANFVILGDHKVNLMIFAVSLGVMLIAQTAAIILLLSRRRRNAKGAKASASALPVVALTVRFIPANLLEIVLAAAALVVVLQAVLIIILVKTDVSAKKRFAHRFDTPPTPAQEETETTMTVLSEEEMEAALEEDDFQGYDEDAPALEPDRELYEEEYDGGDNEPLITLSEDSDEEEPRSDDGGEYDFH